MVEIHGGPTAFRFGSAFRGHLFSPGDWYAYSNAMYHMHYGVCIYIYAHIWCIFTYIKNIHTKKHTVTYPLFLDVGFGFIRRDNFLWGSPGVIFVHHQKVSSTPKKQNVCSRWWFQPIWKIFVNLGLISPKIRGWKNKKHLSPPSSVSLNQKTKHSLFYKAVGSWKFQPSKIFHWVRSLTSFPLPPLDVRIFCPSSTFGPQQELPRYQLEVNIWRSLRDDFFWVFFWWLLTYETGKSQWKEKNLSFLGAGGMLVEMCSAKFFEEEKPLGMGGYIFLSPSTRLFCSVVS